MRILPFMQVNDCIIRFIFKFPDGLKNIFFLCIVRTDGVNFVLNNQ